MKHIFATLVVAAVGTIFTGCMTARDQIPGLLRDQADAWNRGDIDAFMQSYWKSPDLTFSGSRGITRGWQTVLDGYKKRYPTRSDMGTLSFDELQVRELGPNAALVLGRWRIDRARPIGGVFSLVWKKTATGWVIIHDHTSADAPSQ